jgi:serine/threonine-protein kinase HipA
MTPAMPTQESITANYRDGRNRSISVSMHRNGSYQPCGLIIFNSLQNIAGFRYHPGYDGPALDPINLNYQASGVRDFAVNRRTNNDMLHRVFVDYLPGAWGINVLQAEFPEFKQLRAADRLHWFGSRTVGSLSFYVKQLTDEKPLQGIERLESIRRRSMDFYLNNSGSVGADKWELESLSSHGGARPKCMFSDKNGGQWLAKFNIDRDVYNFARVEHATSVLARSCGISAVETRCVEFSPGTDMLFVRRFDKLADQRPHKISAFALMREEIVREKNEGDYRMLFDLIEQVCCDQYTAREEMLRRMLFNIAVNNTDDHLKNFEMLLDAEQGCYALSPAFDLTVDPYPSPRITSVFGLARPTLADETLEHIIQNSNLPREMVYRARDEIADGTSHWAQVFQKCGVSEEQISKLDRGMTRSQNQENTQKNKTTMRIPTAQN